MTQVLNVLTQHNPHFVDCSTASNKSCWGGGHSMATWHMVGTLASNSTVILGDNNRTQPFASVS